MTKRLQQQVGLQQVQPGNTLRYQHESTRMKHLNSLQDCVAQIDARCVTHGTPLVVRPGRGSSFPWVGPLRDRAHGRGSSMQGGRLKEAPTEWQCFASDSG